jgi:hypothetical protein
MAHQKMFERSLLLWLLTYSIFLGWSVYLVTSPDGSISFDRVVSDSENPFAPPTNQSKFARWP